MFYSFYFFKQYNRIDNRQKCQPEADQPLAGFYKKTTTS